MKWLCLNGWISPAARCLTNCGSAVPEAFPVNKTSAAKQRFYFVCFLACGQLFAGSSVRVLITDNVALVQIVSGLNFDEFHHVVRVVLNPVFGFGRNKDGVIGFFEQLVLAQGDNGFAFDDNPVLVAEVV